MLDAFPHSSEAPRADGGGGRRIELAPALRHDLTSYNGPSVVFGIMLAGGAYPIVLVAIVIVWTIVAVALSLAAGRASMSELVDVAMAPLLATGYALVGALTGIVWAAIVSTITLPIVYLFVQSLKLRGSLVRLGAVSGGLVGFVAVLPLMLGLPRSGSTLDGWLILALGPGLTTILGQLGGAWGGKRAERYSEGYYELAVALASNRDQQVPRGHSATDPDGTTQRQEPQLQFRIRHMLWIFVWLSLLLSVIRLSGIPYEFVLPLLVGWLVYQSATLYAGALIARWRARRRQPFHVEPLAK